MSIEKLLISQVSSLFNLFLVAALQFADTRSKLQAALSRAIVLTTRFVAAKSFKQLLKAHTYGYRLPSQDARYIRLCLHFPPAYLPSLRMAHVTSISFRQVDTC